MRLRWLAGGIAVAGAAAYRALRRRSERPERAPADPHPRADELRQRIAESRAIVDERDEFEEAETTIDAADASVDERRRSVHERARTTIEDMRGPASDE